MFYFWLGLYEIRSQREASGMFQSSGGNAVGILTPAEARSVKETCFQGEGYDIDWNHGEHQLLVK